MLFSLNPSFIRCTTTVSLSRSPTFTLLRYPMLLSELEKRTVEGSADRAAVSAAGILMREMALTINEEKRAQEEV